MSKRFQAYQHTETGRLLVDIIDTPELIEDFRAMSAVGRPAVQAIAASVTGPIESLPNTAARHAASQFCGWYVGQIMRRHGYRLVNTRGRVTGAPFKTGAVWAYEPTPIQIGKSLPGGVTRRIELTVRRAKGGEVLGDWCALQTASDPARRVHRIVDSTRDFESALENAVSYARRWNYGHILVRDPENIVSPDRWETRS